MSLQPRGPVRRLAGAVARRILRSFVRVLLAVTD